MKIPQKIAQSIAVVAFISASLTFVYAAYMGHNDADSGLFLQSYSDKKGTALDDCGLCHRSGVAPGAKGKAKRLVLNSCDFCHTSTLYGKEDLSITLNAYAKDYLAAGRNAEAFSKISALDSDKDGYSNVDEIAAGTNPGDSGSTPAMKIAPYKIISKEEMDGKKLKVYGQTIFINVTKSKEGDSYFRYRGYLLSDILRIAGMKKNATSVDVISIDGFTHTFDVALLKKTFKQAAPVFGLDKETLGDCGWVRYAPGLRKGAKLPAANALLTFEMNGVEYDPGNLDPKTGKLTGSGPFRIVAPQMINPGPPDLSRMADAACVDKTPVKFRFNDKYEKNSDYCVKTVVAIRVNPMPKGKSDFDWKRKADELIAGKKIVVFGDVGK